MSRGFFYCISDGGVKHLTALILPPNINYLNKGGF